MTGRHTPQLAAAVAGRRPDVGGQAVVLRAAVAVRPVVAADVEDTGAGHPYPGWWVTVDDLLISVPVLAGAAAIEAGCPLWLARVGDAYLAVGGLTTGRTVARPEAQPATAAHPWIHLTRAAAQSVANFTATTISWTSDSARGAAWDAVARGGTARMWTSGGDVTIPFAGLWAVTLTVTWAGGSSGLRQVWVDHDHGGTVVGHGTQAANLTAAAGLSHTTHACVNAAAGDVIRGRGIHVAGVALDVTAAMTVHYVGPGTGPP